MCTVHVVEMAFSYVPFVIRLAAEMTDKSIAEPESLFLHSCWNATNHLPGHLLFHHSLHCTASINNVGLNLGRHAIEMQFNVLLHLIQIRITPLVIVLIEHVEEGFILNLIV